MVMHCAECLVEYREGFTVCADCGAALREGEPPSEQHEELDELESVFESEDSSMLAIAGSLLREAGIRFVERSDSRSLAGRFGYNPAAGSRRLFVDPDEAEEARELLEHAEQARGTAPVLPDSDASHDELLELETRGWDALSGRGEDARDFYRGILHDECVMLFPGGLLLDGPEEILGSFGAQPWSDYAISDTRTVWLGPEAMTLVYRVSAQRAGAASWEALVSSTYLLTDGTWKLAMHQQTPVG